MARGDAHRGAASAWRASDAFTTMPRRMAVDGSVYVEGEFGDGPQGIAEAAVLSCNAFRNSGGAEDLRFATKLPTEPTGA